MVMRGDEEISLLEQSRTKLSRRMAEVAAEGDLAYLRILEQEDDLLLEEMALAKEQFLILE